MINTPQHLIPTSPLGEARRVLVVVRELANTTTGSVPGFLGENTTGEAASHQPLLPHTLALIAAVLAAAGFIGLLLLASKLALPARRLMEATPPPSGRRLEPIEALYRYEGLKAELRKVYLSVLRRLEQLGIRLPRGAAPLEVAARAAEKGHRWAERVARIYRDHAYARGQPPRVVVDEASKLAREL